MDIPCSVIIAQHENSPTSQEIQQALIHGTVEEKIEMMKRLIPSIINDESFVHSIMLVVKYVALTDNHKLKKLLWIYWEAIEKQKANGSLKDEILLVCNNFRKELLSPNEFVRAKVLKLLSRLPYKELIEPLIQAILENMDNRYIFVRRNAVACAFSIFVTFGEDLIGPIQDKLEVIIETDSDLATRRNAFVFLYHLKEVKAIEFIEKMLQSEDSTSDTENLLYLTIVELLRKSCITNPEKKSRYLSLLISFVNSKSISVTLECVNAIVALTKSQASIRVALLGYCRLLSKQNENNVTLFILGKIADLLQTKFKGSSDDHLIDVLTVLTNESYEIRLKGLDIILNLANEHNINIILHSIIDALKKDKGNNELKAMWIPAIRKFAMIFPKETYRAMTTTLLEEYLYLEETEIYSAYDVTRFAHKAINLIPELQHEVIKKCIDLFTDIVSTRALTFVLWILGQYCTSGYNALEVIIHSIGSIPLTLVNESNDTKVVQAEIKRKTKTIILADGTYSTQIVEEKKTTLQPEKKSFLREKLVMEGNYYLKATLAVALAKLTLNLKDNIALYNRWAIEVLLILCEILNFNKRFKTSMEAFNERIKYCIHILSNPANYNFDNTLHIAKEVENKEPIVNEVIASTISNPDVGLVFRQFKDLKNSTDYEIYENESEVITKHKTLISNWQQEVYQLTGYTEPVYAELLVESQDFNVELIITLVNRTKKTLHNVLLETSMDGAKLISKPTGFNLPPGENKVLKFVYKIESTSNIAIHGYIIYYGSSGNIPHNIPFDHITYKLHNHLLPQLITEEQFKKLWREFKGKKQFTWILKGKDTFNALKKVKSMLDMEFIRDIKPNDLIIANLYAKTKLGEDILMNVIAESKENIEMIFDIRAKTEAITEWIKEMIIVGTNDISVINE